MTVPNYGRITELPNYKSRIEPQVTMLDRDAGSGRQRLYVPPPHIHVPWVYPMLIAGIGWSLIVRWIIPDRPGLWVIKVLAALSPLVPIALILRRCSHRGWSIVLGGFFGGAAMWGYKLFGGVLSVRELMQGALFGGIGFLGACVARDLCFGKVPVQDGTLCPYCGYRVDHCAESRCSECGATITDALLEHCPSAQRQWRSSLVFSAAATVVVYALYLCYPFLQGFGFF